MVGPGGSFEVAARLFEEEIAIVAVDDCEVRHAARHFLDEESAILSRDLVPISGSLRGHRNQIAIGSPPTK